MTDNAELVRRLRERADGIPYSAKWVEDEHPDAKLMREAAAALSALPAAQVKGLEWRGMPDLMHASVLGDAGNYYSIRPNENGKWGWRRPGRIVFSWIDGGEAEVKAAAQADYEKRILSALSAPAMPDPTPRVIEGEPVAWLGEASGYKSFTRHKAAAERWRKGGMQVTPVFTTSPSVEALIAERDEARRELGKVADYVERHWQGAGLPLSAGWIIDHLSYHDNERCNELDAAEAENATLKAALRQNFCPRPANQRPEQFAVGDCIDAGECGCMNADALAQITDKDG